MKNLSKLILYFIVITSILSCNNNDNDVIDVNQNHELVGVWQRNDFSKNFEYKLYLNSDDISYQTLAEYYDDGKAISSLITLNWSTKGNQLTLIFSDDEEINTPYSFNSDGQLILSGLTDLPFNKLE